MIGTNTMSMPNVMYMHNVSLGIISNFLLSVMVYILLYIIDMYYRDICEHISIYVYIDMYIIYSVTVYYHCGKFC